MLLLTETNFLLDITFEQSPECDRLFLLTREQNIPVVIPEYSFAEAEGNIFTCPPHPVGRKGERYSLLWRDCGAVRIARGASTCAV
jgi:hypothetical protein